MTLAERIQKRIADLGLTPHGVSVAAGLNPRFINQLIRGEKASIGSKAVEALAPILKTTPSWLIWGADPTTGLRSLPVLSMVGAGAAVVPFNSDPLDEVAVEPNLPDDAFALVVRGGSMQPIYDDGDVLVCVPNDETEALIYRQAVVDLADGRRLVKRLARGSKSGLYTLESLAAEPIRDVEVVRAAKIISVKKA